jgi:RAB protein geranylgeranyltransferase component A
MTMNSLLTFCASRIAVRRDQLYKKFRGTEPPAELGRDRDYAVDLIPKLCVSLFRLPSRHTLTPSRTTA